MVWRAVMENGEEKVFDVVFPSHSLPPFLVALFFFNFYIVAVVVFVVLFFFLIFSFFFFFFVLFIECAVHKHIYFIHRKWKRSTEKWHRVCVLVRVRRIDAFYMIFGCFYVAWWPFHSRCLFHPFGSKFSLSIWPNVYFIRHRKFPFGLTNSKAFAHLLDQPNGGWAKYFFDVHQI